MDSSFSYFHNAWQSMIVARGLEFPVILLAVIAGIICIIAVSRFSRKSSATGEPAAQNDEINPEVIAAISCACHSFRSSINNEIITAIALACNSFKTSTGYLPAAPGAISTETVAAIGLAFHTSATAKAK